MNKFSQKSLDILSTVDSRLQDVCNTVLQVYDITVICGHRGEEEQNKAFNEGKSQKKFPDGKHNSLPSKAVDIAPYPIDENDKSRFILLAGLMVGVGLSKGYTIRWGGAWNGLSTMKDNKFNDLFHFEIIG